MYAENEDFDQGSGCAAPKRWSKYTTLQFCFILMLTSEQSYAVFQSIPEFKSIISYRSLTHASVYRFLSLSISLFIYMSVCLSFFSLSDFHTFKLSCFLFVFITYLFLISLFFVCQIYLSFSLFVSSLIFASLCSRLAIQHNQSFEIFLLLGMMCLCLLL